MPDTPSKQDGPSPSTTLSTPSTAPASSILQEPVGVPHISSSTQETNSFPSAPDDTSPTKRVRSGSSEQVNSSAKRSSKRIDTQQIRNDRLGTLVRQLCESLHESPSWESFVNEFRGPSYLSPDLDNIDHPAAPLLRQWRSRPRRPSRVRHRALVPRAKGRLHQARMPLLCKRARRLHPRRDGRFH